MRSIEITFHKQVSPKQQKVVLRKINSWQSIESVGHIMEDSIDEDIRRMAFAYVKDEAELEAVSKKIEAISEIETAPIPTKRHL